MKKAIEESKTVEVEDQTTVEADAPNSESAAEDLAEKVEGGQTESTDKEVKWPEGMVEGIENEIRRLPHFGGAWAGMRNEPRRLYTAVAYAALLMRRAGPDSGFEEAVEEEESSANVKEFLLGNGFDDTWQETARCLCEDENISDGELAEYVRCALSEEPASSSNRWYSGEGDTPSSVRKLALAILDIHDGDSVADLGCGTGNFLVEASSAANDVTLYGVDINPEAACIAQMRLALTESSETVSCANALEANAVPNGSFDKVFTNYPFGLTARNAPGADGIFKEMLGDRELNTSRLNVDWAFNKLAFDALAENGEALVVMTSGAAYNYKEREFRRYFVDKGMLKAIVALPEKLFSGTGIAVMLAVLGRNDGPIRMVDATDLYEKTRKASNRRQSSMGQAEIDEVLSRLGRDGALSKLVGVDDIQAQDYVLDPKRYLMPKGNWVNPKNLGDLALSIDRGPSINAKQLDELVSEEPTNFRYLRLADIEDGCMGTELMYLKELEGTLEQSCLEDGDLLISRIGEPFKVTVAEVPEGQKVLPCSNIFAIRLKTELVDPWFVAAFLTSEAGQRIVQNLASGTALRSISLRGLKSLTVPLPDMEIQKEVSLRMRESVRKARELKQELALTRKEIAEAYDGTMPSGR